MKNLDKLAELAKALPAELQEGANSLIERMGEVIEGIGDSPLEWRPENLKLVQGTSDRGKLPKDATIGSIVLGDTVVKQPLEVIPLRMITTRQYWNPDPDKPQMICQSPDGVVGYQYGSCRACPYQKFDEEANKSQCNKSITVLCITSDLSRVFIANFSKTNYANGTDWQKAMKHAGVSSYKRKYSLTSETSKKSKNVEVLRAEPVQGGRVEGEVLAFIEALFNSTGEDRTQQLVKFYDYVEQRKNNATALGAPQDSGITLISAPTEEDIIQVQERETADTAKATEMREKYKL